MDCLRHGIGRQPTRQPKNNFSDASKTDVIRLNAAITGYVKSLRWDSALVLFFNARLASNEVDVITYSACITACEKGRQWELALHLLCDFSRSDLKSDVVLCSAAVSACEKSQQSEQAYRLVSEMNSMGPEPNVFAYNALISAYGNGQEWPRAAGQLVELCRRGLEPSAVTCNASISACEKAQEWKRSLRAIRFMRQSGTRASLFTFSAILSQRYDFKWDRAVTAFSQLQRRSLEGNLIVVNAAIGACEKSQQWRNAFRLLSSLGGRSTGMELDTVTHGGTIRAWSKGQKWNRALQAFDDAQERGAVPCLPCYNAASSACESCGRWEVSSSLFGQLRRCEAEPGLITYSSASAGDGRPWEHALRDLGELCQRGGAPNAVVCNAGVNTCGQERFWEQSLHLFGGLRCRELELDVITYTSAAGSREHAPRLLGELRQEGIEINVIACNAVVSACGERHCWEEALCLLDGTKRHRLSPNLVTYNAALSACGRGEVVVAPVLGMLAELRQRRLEADLVTYNAAIAASAAAGQWREALHRLRSLQESALLADVVSWGAAVSACGERRPWRRALDLLRAAAWDGRGVGNGAGLNTIICGAAVVACAGGSGLEDSGEGSWERLMALLAGMVAQEVEPDVGSCAVLLTECEQIAAQVVATGAAGLGLPLALVLLSGACRRV